MAVLKLVLTQARRHCATKPSLLLPPPPFLGFHRSLSSSSPSDDQSDLSPNSSPNESPRRTFQPASIQPVSYSPKPKDQSEPEQESSTSSRSLPPWGAGESSSPPIMESRTSWTREDFRYVKDVPLISPVSYPSRVAPLPEDKNSDSGEAEKESDEMERERRKIEAENQYRRRVFRVAEQDQVVVPFPMPIKVEKKQQKTVLDLAEAIRQVKSNARETFDETVEVHARLAVDARKMQVLGNMTLPHSIGKKVKVAFFAEGSDADEARAAGADIVGGLELIEEIARSRKFNVDKCFSTPEMMRRLGKISKILRQRGLLPDPKLGTVTSDIRGALKKARDGHMHFKMDTTSIVHVGLGKVGFTEHTLQENIGAFVNALLNAKPAGLKKASKYAGYVNSFHICSTMGPGFPVSIQSLSKAADQHNRKYLAGAIR